MGCKALCQALRSGACPRLETLVVRKGDRVTRDEAVEMVSDLGEILHIRAEDKGCSAIKALKLHVSVDLSSFFSSSAASDSLEEICVLGADDEACDAFSEWARRTKAPRLRAFAGSSEVPSWSVPADLIRALSLEGVAPTLQSFAPGYVDDEGLTVLTEAMERGAWRNLRLFGLHEEYDWDYHLAGDMLTRLINALHANNPELETLELQLTSGPDEDSWGICRLVAQALRDGAWPQLKKLDLGECRITVNDMTILAQTLEDRPACTNSLRTLNFGGCRLEKAHFRVLASAFERGACPYLEELDLSENCLELGGDGEGLGVVHLANGLEAGALPSLKEIDLSHSNISDDEVIALSDALSSNNACPRLEWLSIAPKHFGPRVDHHVVAELLERLEATRGPDKVTVVVW